MRSNLASPLVAVLFLCACGGVASLAGGDDDHGFTPVITEAQAKAKGLQLATFAAGCFWCTESPFEGLPGVKEVVSGYTGGTMERPTYQAVSSGGTGHKEAVQVLFDPRQTTYEKLLYVYWRNVDPFAAGGMFCDQGEQYRGFIFVHGAEQRRLAEAGKAEVAKRFGKPVTVAIEDAATFWPAENYHQDYCFKNPLRYKAYKTGCGRDARLQELWGDEASPHGKHG
ncbi:MAG TPA: peptide-methionine (S)-S-oxide reductase MsrA [Candidatus Polarisedimenticolaceae bacterium]|nr:peptide-methionine (S)-S-oxide reductase MsrA [Candidatus Polarisedimenticolaceae bacterium]